MKIEKVMIVDDDEDVRAISVLAARKIGNWAVVSVGSGDEAVALAPVERPDVILLDVMMPAPDGPATMALLRDDPVTATIPIIFLTAMAQRHDIERYLELGACGVICKPFDATALPDEIRRILQAE
ncbi:MAG: response regulator [Deltaproteobacteria bacterium]|nr:response regulator [Deltaproteobacteria bacterium]MBW2399308.1 response regulator [Deltaproteobacteria bacterium]